MSETPEGKVVELPLSVHGDHALNPAGWEASCAQENSAHGEILDYAKVAEAHFNRGRAMAHENNPALAIEAYKRAADLSPSQIRYHLALAEALEKQHRFREAALSYCHVLELWPDHLEALVGLAVSLHKMGDLETAMPVYLRAVQLNPECAQAYTNLGIAYQDKGDLDAAAECQRRAIELSPRMASAHNNLGVVLLRLGRTGEALSCFLRTLSLKPGHSGAHFNIGDAFQGMGFLELAERYYRKALELKPHSDTLRFYLGMLHLLQGNFSQGWPEYEFRWGSRHQRANRRNFAQPQWKGEPLQGATILLYGEQGLGDTMQFLRYVPMVAALGGKVLLEVQPPLHRLAASVEGASHVFSQGDRLPEFQWQCPLMSLPLAFKTELESIPDSVPYLRASDAAARLWAGKLGGSRLRVGLVWGGNPKHSRERERAIPLEKLLPLTSIEGVKFYSLQKGAAAAQLQNMQPGTAIIDLDAQQRDFADTAAIVANLDLVISIDTSVAHLAGAMGKPVWVLLHHASDWRWLLNREDSPWYPTARLFRKSMGESWEGLIRRVQHELILLAGSSVRENEKGVSTSCSLI